MSTKPDPIFAVYAKYAPVRDLNFYLTYATRHNAEFSARTPAIVREMIALSSALSARLNGEKSTAPASTTAQKATRVDVDRSVQGIDRGLVWECGRGAVGTTGVDGSAVP